MELVLLSLLLIKHTIVDLALQHYIKGQKKLQWLNPLAHWHYAQHGIGTLIVTLPLTGDLLVAASVSLLDYLIHWHVDFCKSCVRQHYGWEEQDLSFWVLQSVDQILHYLTYILFSLLVLQFYV